MLFPEAPLESFLHRDPAQVLMGIRALQFVQHVLDFDKDHLSLAGNFPCFLAGLGGSPQFGPLEGLSKMLQGQGKERDALCDTVDLYPGLCKLTCGSVEE